jgi:hypothetical protein
MHGGTIPRVAAAARRRVARERLEGEVGELLDVFEAEAADRHPVEVLLDGLHRAAALMRLWGELVARLSPPGGVSERTWTPAVVEGAGGHLYGPSHTGDQAVHVAVGEYERAIERAAKVAKLALDAGVEERQVRLAEEQGDLLGRVLEVAAAALVDRVRRTDPVLAGELAGEVGGIVRAAIVSVVPGELAAAG